MPSGPATKLLYSVAGRVVLINTYDHWSSTALKQLFSGWYLNPVQDPLANPDTIVNVRCGVAPPPVPPGLITFDIIHGGTCYTDNETYYLVFQDSLIVFGPGRYPEVNLWVAQPYSLPSAIVTQLLSHALSPALRRCDVFEIHSAAVVVPGRTDALMLPGPSGSGKSTLTSQLARCGWGYLSDDILLLTEREQRIEAQALRRFFALTADTMAAVKLQTANGGGAVKKERVTPQEHFKRGPINTARVATIVFPEITTGATTRLRQLNSVESMQRLLRLCPWASYDKPTSAEHLKVLGLLAGTTSAFELMAGADVLTDPSAPAELLARATEESGN